MTAITTICSRHWYSNETITGKCYTATRWWRANTEYADALLYTDIKMTLTTGSRHKEVAHG